MLALLLVCLALCLHTLAGLFGIAAAPLLLVVLAVLVIFYVAITVHKMRVTRGLLARNQEAVASLNQGRRAEALEAFEACEADAKRAWLRQLAPLFAANRAAALCRLSRATEAVVVCRQLRGQPNIQASLKQHWGTFISVCVGGTTLAGA